MDELLDFLGRLGAALGQCAHLSRHHGKATALLAGTRGFHGRIQGQDIGLEGNRVDHADDVGDLAAAVVDALHGVHHLGNHIPASTRDIGGILCHLIGCLGVVGVLAHGRAQLLHGGRRFLQGAGLAFGARRKIRIALSDFAGRKGHAMGIAAHILDHGGQLPTHVFQRIEQQAHFIAALVLHHHAQPAGSHGLRQLNCRGHGGRDGTCHRNADHGGKQHHQRQRA